MKEINELPVIPFFDKQEPRFDGPVNQLWYTASNPLNFEGMPKPMLESRVEDLVFVTTRSESEEKIGWTEFNRKETNSNLDVSAMGFLPLILNPAHEFSTLHCVLLRCISLADKLGKKHIVLTADQAVYCKLVEVRWASQTFRNRIVLRMGGLHIALNFMKVIGKQMAGSGLGDLWVASGLLAEGSVTKVLDGKAYGKGIRAHKLTLQAFWRRIYPQFMNFLEEQDSTEAGNLSTKAANVDELREYLSSPIALKYLSTFLQEKSEVDKIFNLWWTYIDMVLTLLMFTRGIRGGDWKCYSGALSDMLPYMALYDHGNYLKSLSVYIADMNQLPS